MNNMKYYRQRKGYSISELSIRTGIHSNTLIHLEKSECPCTKVINLVKISRVLGESIEDIFLK